MAYTVLNHKTKKALKEAVANYHARVADPKAFFGTLVGCPVKCYQPGLGSDLSNFTGNVTLEGPHYPKPHTWYAEAVLKDGMVVKVK